MARSTRDMTVSELSSLSTIPLSTIKFYIRENLIPRSEEDEGDAGLLRREGTFTGSS